MYRRIIYQLDTLKYLYWSKIGTADFNNLTASGSRNFEYFEVSNFKIWLFA